MEKLETFSLVNYIHLHKRIFVYKLEFTGGYIYVHVCVHMCLICTSFFYDVIYAATGNVTNNTVAQKYSIFYEHFWPPNDKCLHSFLKYNIVLYIFGIFFIGPANT